MNTSLTRALSSWLLLALFATISACGGGGSSSSTTATTTPVAASPTLTLTGSTTSISATAGATLSATLKSGTGAALPGVVVTFKTTGTNFGALSPVGASALTDANGVATITLNAGTTSGADSVTATATVNGTTVTSNLFGFTAVGTTTAAVVSAISLSSSLTTVASDNSTTSTVVATVVDGSNAALPGITVTFSTDTGVLSAASAVTDASGRAQVTFSSGSSNPATRTATITATASGKTTQIPVRIGGAALTLATSTSSLVTGGTAATLTVTLKNASGGALANQSVTLSASGTGSVAITPTTGTTDANGQFTATAVGTVAGNVTVIATAAGESRTVALAVAGVSTAFQITAPSADPSANAATLGSTVTVTVQAPAPTTSVTFVSTLGTWDGTSSSVITKTVTGGAVSANLVSTSAGVANIQVYDTQRQSALTASRTVSYTASAANAFKITLQSTPSVVAPSSGGNAGLSTLVATVTDASGNPVGNASVAFTIVNPTGGGETITPAVILTSGVATSTTTLGQATAIFTAGSLPSGATGVQVRARVVGTNIATNTVPSGSDATIVIGGTAGSVTIGISTQITPDTAGTIYTLPMSVLVADSNGNPVVNSTVSLSTWPIAFNAGGNLCAPTTTLPGGAVVSTAPGTFYFNEDRNENLIRDPSEVTSVRLFYPSAQPSTSVPSANQLSPPNSAAGTLPATVTTNSSGVASFTLTYTKSNGGYIYDRIRARTLVQGTETLGEIKFLLPVLTDDLGTPGTSSCHLSPSPYT